MTYRGILNFKIFWPLKILPSNGFSQKLNFSGVKYVYIDFYMSFTNIQNINYLYPGGATSIQYDKPQGNSSNVCYDIPVPQGSSSHCDDDDEIEQLGNVHYDNTEVFPPRPLLNTWPYILGWIQIVLGFLAAIFGKLNKQS